MAADSLDIDRLLEESLEAKTKKASPPRERETKAPVIEKDREDERKRKRSHSQETEESRDSKRRRSRERSRDRERDRDSRPRRTSSHRERSRSRERERERDRDPRRSPDRRGERYRPRERDGRDDRRDGGRDDRRDDRRDGGRDDRRRPSPERGGRGSERGRDNRKKEPSPNPDDATRGARTVFAYNLPTKANAQDIWKFFEQAGKVRDVKMIQDRNSRKSKGFGYIEMDSINSVTAAIQLSGTQLMGKTVMVQASQSDRNEVQTQQKKQLPTRLYVGGLHVNVTEQDIESMFSEFGDVNAVDLHREPETGHSKGFAFVQFRDPEAAKRALVQVNGRELAGRVLKVGLVNTAANGKGPGGELDDETGMSLDAQSRVELMSKLQRSEEKPLGSSPFLKLKYMFTEEESREPNFEQELSEDIREECAKWGELRHVNVDRNNPDGVVYLRFNNISQATAAHNELNGRWFGGRMIEAQYVPEANYLKMFPHAR